MRSLDWYAVLLSSVTGILLLESIQAGELAGTYDLDINEVAGLVYGPMQKHHRRCYPGEEVDRARQKSWRFFIYLVSASCHLHNLTNNNNNGGHASANRERTS